MLTIGSLRQADVTGGGPAVIGRGALNDTVDRIAMAGVRRRVPFRPRGLALDVIAAAARHR
jgi:hypothetical protein